MQLGSGQDVVVRSVAPGDLEAVAAVAARAFADDPAFRWFLPNDRTRLGKLTKFFELFSGSELALDFADLTTTSDHAGLCAWLGPDRWEPPTRSMLGPTARIFFTVGPKSFVKFMVAMAAMKKHHHKEPHWYLSTLATDPPRQRSGIGGALLADGLARCDREGLPAYLETQKEENVGYYARFGFRVTDEIVLSMGGPRLWLMWRDPQ